MSARIFRALLLLYPRRFRSLAVTALLLACQPLVGDVRRFASAPAIA